MAKKKNKRPPIKLILSILVIVGGVVYAYFQFNEFQETEVRQMNSELATIRKKVEQKKQELRRLQDFASKIDAIKEELREINAKRETALESMPPTFNLSSLLRQFTLLAQNTGTELTLFKPGKEGDKQTGDFYTSITIDLELRGTYVETLAFFDQLSRLKRIVSIEGLQIAKGPAVGRLGTIQAVTKASVRTYRFSQ